MIISATTISIGYLIAEGFRWRKANRDEDVRLNLLGESAGIPKRPGESRKAYKRRLRETRIRSDAIR